MTGRRRPAPPAPAHEQLHEVHRGVLREPTPSQLQAAVVLPFVKLAAQRPDRFAELYGDRGAALMARVYALFADGVHDPATMRAERAQRVARWRERFSDDDDEARSQLLRLGRDAGLPLDLSIVPLTSEALDLARRFDPSGRGGRGKRGHAFLTALVTALSGVSYVERKPGEKMATTVAREQRRTEDAEKKRARGA